MKDQGMHTSRVQVIRVFYRSDESAGGFIDKLFGLPVPIFWRSPEQSLTVDAPQPIAIHVRILYVEFDPQKLLTNVTESDQGSRHDGV